MCLHKAYRSFDVNGNSPDGSPGSDGRHLRPIPTPGGSPCWLLLSSCSACDPRRASKERGRAAERTGLDRLEPPRRLVKSPSEGKYLLGTCSQRNEPNAP